MHLDRMEWPADKVVASSLVMPEEQRTESKASSAFGISFLLQSAMDEVGSVCLTEPPEMMQFLLWTTLSVFGIVYILLGYRFLRIVGFLSGLAAGSGCILFIQKQNIPMFGGPTDSALAVVSGLLGAVLGSTHPIASALVSGFAGAIVSAVTVAFCVISFPHHEFGEREIVVAICGGAVIFAVLTLCCTKLVTILTSSIVGATMIILAVDFFMHDLGTLKWIITIHPNPAPPPCWGGVIVFMWPVVIIVGVLVQSFITAWQVDHQKPHFHHQPLITAADRERMPRNMNMAAHPSMHAGAHCDPNALNRTRSGNNRQPETKEEARQKKYRYLYRVRTAHGDIISKNYVSALQRRIQPGSPPSAGPSTSTKMGSQERDTFRSDRTRMTNLMDTNSAERDRTTICFED